MKTRPVHEGSPTLIKKSVRLLTLLAITSSLVTTSINTYAQGGCSGYVTYTMGGWGAACHGGNAGCYLVSNFSAAFPGGLTIGVNNQLVLTSAAAVTAFLPSGGTPATLPAGTLTDPGNTYSNTLAGQLVALTLSVGFDNYDPNFAPAAGNLRNLVINSGPFAGMTVGTFLSLADSAIGGYPSAFTISQFNGAATSINMNYDGGLTDGGFLSCAGDSVSIVVSAHVLCNGDLNGALTANAHGGITPYTYSWSNSAVTPGISNLPAGGYSVTVSDASGNTASASIIVTQPSVLTASATPVNILCNGGTGSASVTAGGGTLPYTYSWSNGQTVTNITGLTPGGYSVTVTDNNGCATSTSVTITQPPVLTAGATPVNILCNGGMGSGSVTAGGGTLPYTYSWSNGQSVTNITGLAPGGYSVTVTDNNGCSATAGITVTQPTLLTASATPVNILCNGGTGSGSVIAGGGTLPYTYSWSNSQTVSDITGLTPGGYSVTVTDSNGCSATAGITITQPSVLTASATPVNILCNGGVGSGSVTAGGGTLPYTYSWSSGQVTSNITGLTPGGYNVTVTDNNGCSATAGITITQPALLTASATPTNILCNGGVGSGSVTAGGGTLPYTYSWSNGQSVTNITGLTPGGYSVTVTDNNGCSATAGITITQPALLTASATPVNILCNGGVGSGSVTAGGGTLPYTYSWSNGQVTSNITGLTPGGYNVTVTDNNGCSATAGITITQPALLTASATPTNILCNGGVGSGSVTAGGGTLPYTYSWSSGQVTSNITGLTPGGYNVTVTDNNGCSATAGITITQPALLTASATPVNILCNGGVGSGSVTAGGGTLPYTYSWSNGGITANNTGLSAGGYSVTVTDNNGCSATAAITITQPALLTASTTPVNVLCNGGVGSGSVTVSGGKSPYTYSWSNGRGAPNNTGLSAGGYSVTVTDNNGCSATAAITITQPPVLTASATPVNVLCHGGVGSGSVTASGGTLPYTYSWSNGRVTPNNTGLSAGSYNVTVTDNNGCSATAHITVTQPASLAISMSESDATCYGGDGSATANVTGGTLPYTYSWNDSLLQTTATAILPVGTWKVTVTDNHNCSVSDSVKVNLVSCAGFLTYTMGGWGTACHGGNPGCYRDAHFASAFPSGLVVGSNGKYLKFTSSSAIQNFLPSSGTPAALSSGTKVNPTSSNVKNTLAGQVVALTLSVVFDENDPSFAPAAGNLANLIIVSGTFKGWTVTEILNEANNALGGISAYSCSALSDALNSINSNYDGGANAGFLACPCAELKAAHHHSGGETIVEDNQGEDMLNIYPNPATMNASVEFSLSQDDGNVRIEVYSITGQLVYAPATITVRANEVYTQQLNVSGFKSGVYIVRLISDRSVITKRLIINK